MRHARIVYRSEDLKLGFDGNSVHFEHREFEDRSPEAQAAYLRLKDSLLSEGMIDPLITYCGHVLIGMRRFEILREVQDEFTCIEILEDVPNWKSGDIRRLQDFKRDVYDLERISRYQG